MKTKDKEEIVNAVISKIFWKTFGWVICILIAGFFVYFIYNIGYQNGSWATYDSLESLACRMEYWDNN